MRFSGLATIGSAAISCLALACSSNASGGGNTAGNEVSRSDAATSGASVPQSSDSSGPPSGSTVNDAGGAEDAADASPCAGYSGTVDSYSANLAKVGTSGDLQFILMNAQPAPPSKGDNIWTLKVLDSAGTPVQGAKFAIKTWMPMMRHGSSIAPQQAANADSTYSISNLYLTMAGIWQVTFTTQSGTTKDTATYTFCVGG